MATLGEDDGIIQWIFGGLVTIVGAFLGLLNKKVDKKVSKDVFQEFKNGNHSAHQMTHQQLQEIKETQERIFEKLDGKADKSSHR